MILGIGTDLTDIRRIEKTLERYGEAFENRIFTVREQKKAKSRKNAGKKTMAATYAKRFAAKEACAKALGTGMKKGITWHDIEITNAGSGYPSLILHGEARLYLKSITPKGLTAKIHLSVSDEYPFAQAMVVIEAL
jgi:holo-[acyl-carrier protein] synthase